MKHLTFNSSRLNVSIAILTSLLHIGWIEKMKKSMLMQILKTGQKQKTHTPEDTKHLNTQVMRLLSLLHTFYVSYEFL